MYDGEGPLYRNRQVVLSLRSHAASFPHDRCSVD